MAVNVISPTALISKYPFVSPDVIEYVTLSPASVSTACTVPRTAISVAFSLYENSYASPVVLFSVSNSGASSLISSSDSFTLTSVVLLFVSVAVTTMSWTFANAS